MKLRKGDDILVKAVVSKVKPLIITIGNNIVEQLIAIKDVDSKYVAKLDVSDLPSQLVEFLEQYGENALDNYLSMTRYTSYEGMPDFSKSPSLSWLSFSHYGDGEGFAWEDSPQGYDYWNTLYEEWRAFLDENELIPITLIKKGGKDYITSASLKQLAKRLH